MGICSFPSGCYNFSLEFQSKMASEVKMKKTLYTKIFPTSFTSCIRKKNYRSEQKVGINYIYGVKSKRQEKLTTRKLQSWLCDLNK